MPQAAFEPLEAQWRSRGLWPAGGIDEAGRGPLAGPVTIGLVQFNEFPETLPSALRGLDDSKKLSEADRERLYALIRQHSLFSGSVHISARRIDRVGINVAIELGILTILRRAQSSALPLAALAVDGNYRLARVREARPDLHIESVIRGDSRVLSIAAASVIAKVDRDRRMKRYAKRFPGYGLERHKGYGTAEHRRRILELGPSPIHRRSFRW